MFGISDMWPTIALTFSYGLFKIPAQHRVFPLSPYCHAIEEERIGYDWKEKDKIWGY